jgi:arylsulfatase A-like enzyme/predicted Zn-dependent protease
MNHRNRRSLPNTYPIFVAGTSRLRLRHFALLLLTAIWAVSCAPSDKKPDDLGQNDLNVILVTIDTLRADHVGVYGGLAKTPSLDRLASEGVVFDRCISQTPLTLPSHTTILSGTYPNYHGVRDNGGFVVPDNLELISETLQRHGYATSAFIGAYVLHSKWGLDQGFDHYSDTFDRGRYRRLLLQNSKRADEVVASAQEWIGDHLDRPFFSWIHLFDPHTPYEPPPPFDVTSGSRYRGEVEYTDHVLGDFFQFLDDQGLLDRSMIIVTADHGEGLGEHGEREHGFFVYDSTVRVPLILRPPFGPSASRWGGLVELVDIVPTILDGLQLETPSDVQGRSLWPVLLGNNIDTERPGYSETFYPRLHYGWSELRAFYHNDMKLVEAPRPELFDLRNDAGEQVDLALDLTSSNDLTAIRAELRRRLDDLSQDALAPSAAVISREDRAALQALGYVTTTVTNNNQVQLADPKDKIGVFTRLADAAALLTEHRFHEAMAIAGEAAATDPYLVDAHVILGNAYRGAGMLTEAVKRYRRALELKPDSNFVMIDLLGCLIDSSAYADAIEEGLRFLHIFPEDPILHELIGSAYTLAEDSTHALHHLEKSIAILPDSRILASVGELYFRTGRNDDAARALEQAIEMDPTTRAAWYLLGRIAEREGRTDDALSLYRRELANHSDAYMAALHTALILAEHDQRDEAIRFCRIAIEAEPPLGLPYFMIAAHHLEQGTDYKEAIALCRAGIQAAPEDQSTLAGYQTLLRLLEKTGNQTDFDRTAKEAGELRRRLESPES